MADPTGGPPPETGTANFDRLYRLLGFDPGREPGPRSDTPGGVFADAVREVVAERLKVARDRAVGLIRQAIELKAKWDEEERRFATARRKFNKEFGKTIGRIEAIARGEPPASDEPATADGE